MNPFYTFLKKRLKQEPLPGRRSQLKMVPEPKTRRASRRSMNAPPETTPSSVLLLLFPGQERLELILTLRTETINHGGQISLPGGRAEQGEDAITTALREAREEISITPEDVTIVGTLSSLYVAHSQNNVTPVVGFLNYKPNLKINPDEVEEAFSVTVEALMGKDNLVVEDWNLHDDATFKVPYWDVHRVPLWGATAMILSEFLELYQEYKKQKTSNK